MDLAALQARLQQALGTEFTVGPLLGQGGFAAVFRVRDTTLERDVAVKVLDLDLAPSPTVAERFLREAQTVARLEHPNIVPIHKVGRQDEVFYLIMRCIDGPSLRQLLGTHKRLSVGDAARIARQVADALAYAHTQGVIHRDIKPDNILLDQNGHVLVTDFGIAKAAQAAAAPAAQQLTTEGMVIGTPQYMSPEQAAGEKVDGRSDIYGLGIVLYQMLSGAPPFDGDSSAAILAQQLTADPAPIRGERPDVSNELALVLDRMLAKDPGERFQTARDASRALIEALPTAARDLVRVPLRRRLASMAFKSLVGLAVGGCLAFVAFAAGAFVVAYTVFSKAPKLAARAPLPESLMQELRRRRILAARDAAVYAFAPGGAEDSVLFLVTRRTLTMVTPRTVRSYSRDSAAADLDVDLRGGIRFRLVVRRTGAAPDTVYRGLSLREALALAPQLPGDAGARAGIRVQRPGDAPLRIERRRSP